MTYYNVVREGSCVQSIAATVITWDYLVMFGRVVLETYEWTDTQRQTYRRPYRNTSHPTGTSFRRDFARFCGNFNSPQATRVF